MQHLTIHQLGPIEHCELDVKRFMVLTGAQASGKSTIAKCLFFFKNIKNIFYMQIRKRYLLKDVDQETTMEFSVRKRLMREIRSNFLQSFGSTWCMDNSMFFQYTYSEDVVIRISLKKDYVSPNYIWIDFSDAVQSFIESIDFSLQRQEGAVSYEDFAAIKKQIDVFFNDYEETIYIPAGRSMITLLSTQLNYIYSSMDDIQRRSLDYCTQNYLERILQMKPAFSLSAAQMIDRTLSLTDKKINRKVLKDAERLMKEILKGEYRDVEGEERLQVSKDRYVKINVASSGQQESLWILNVLFHSLVNGKKSCFIIEEPESHLFPNAQKLMAEFIALSSCGGENQILVTTHSPYILGTFNNLLYADKISKTVDAEKLEQIIPSQRWLGFDNLAAFYICGGKMEECMDREFRSIENEVIDGASSDINEDYSKMVLLKEECTEGGKL